MAAELQGNLDGEHKYIFIEDVAQNQRRSLFVRETHRRKKWQRLHALRTRQVLQFPWRHIPPASPQTVALRTSSNATRNGTSSKVTTDAKVGAQTKLPPTKVETTNSDAVRSCHYHKVDMDLEHLPQSKGIDARKLSNVQQKRLDISRNVSPNYDIMMNLLETLRPKAQLGSFNSMDPFDVFAIPLPRSTREVLHYLKSTFTAYPSSLNPEGSWFNWAISEPSLLSVGISMVGYHFRNLPGRQKTSVHLQLKSYAICLTQRSLEASAFGNVSIATIATVSGLLHIESMFGERDDAEPHRRALAKMISMAGGFQAFDSLNNPNPRVFQRVLRWTETLYATRFDTIPILPAPIHDPLTTKLDRYLTKYTPISPPHSPRHVLKLCPSHPEISSAITMVQRINAAMQTPNLSLLERKMMIDNLFILEHRLLTLHDLSPLQPVKQLLCLDLSEAFRIAILLYLHVCLMYIPRETKVHNRIVIRLHRSINAQWPLLKNGSTGPTTDLVAWTLFLGGIAVSLPFERRYFGTKLRELVGSDEESIKIRLRMVAWRSNSCDDALKTLLEDSA